MKKSIPKFEILSEELTSHMTYYKFNKMDKHLTEKYRKGRINAAKWVCDLIFFYIQKESNFVFKFKNQIENQRKEIENIKDGDFKQGLYDELKIVEEILNDRNK